MENKEQNENKEQSSTFAERVTNIQEQAKKKAFEKKSVQQQKPKYNLSDQERKWARATLPLMQDDAFKVFEEMCNAITINQLNKAYDVPPEHWLPSKETTYGEKCSVNRGVLVGLQLQLSNLKTLWKIELALQAEEDKRKGA